MGTYVLYPNRCSCQPRRIVACGSCSPSPAGAATSSRCCRRRRPPAPPAMPSPSRGRPSILPVVEGRGFEAFPAEPPGSRRSGSRCQELDPEREARDFRDGFADRLAHQSAPLVAALCDDWRPDVVVCDETDFGAMVAAESLGVPYASVVTIAAGTFARPELIAEPLGRAPRGARAAARSGARVSLAAPRPRAVPAELPRSRVPAAADRSLLPPVRPAARAPRRRRRRSTSRSAPSSTSSRAISSRASSPACRSFRSRWWRRSGRRSIPAELGPLPPHVRVERFLPQSDVLARCSAVVSHGGSGSVLGALAHGLPQVLIPMGADQPLNAARCEQLGVARVLDPVAATPDDVREAVDGRAGRAGATATRPSGCGRSSPRSRGLSARWSCWSGCDSGRVSVRIDSSLDGIDWAARAGRPDRRRVRQRTLAGGAQALVRAVPARRDRPRRRPRRRDGEAALRRRLQRLRRRRLDGVVAPPAGNRDRDDAAADRRGSRASTSGSRPTTPRRSTSRSASEPQPEFWSLVSGRWLDNDANRL